ncbi:MAG: DUF2934 domain-containing protein [Steroidobacteraceae bacterium]
MQTNSARYFNFNPLRFSLPPRKAPEDRQAMIAQAAYFRAQQRHFEPGHELEDWLAAESEVDRRIAQARGEQGAAGGW